MQEITNQHRNMKPSTVESRRTAHRQLQYNVRSAMIL